MWRDVQRYASHAAAETEVQAFRAAADEVHFWAAGTDLDSERVPYYDNRLGIDTAEVALNIAQQWGVEFEHLSLAPNQVNEEQILKQELYGLLLLVAQSRLHLLKGEREAEYVL